MSDQTSVVHFRLDFGVRELCLTPPSERSGIAYPIIFAYGGTRNLRVEVEPKVGPRHAMAGRAYGTYAPRQNVFDALSAVARGELPNGSAFPDKEAELRVVRAPGSRQLREKIPPLFILPQSVRSFIEMVTRELWDLARRTSRTIRWRTGSHGPHNPFSSGGTFWTVENSGTWHPVPSDGTVRVGLSGSTSLRPMLVDEIVRLVADGKDEPLARQVLREANEQRDTNRRSALLLGFVAVEIGMKALVASRGPEAGWMAWEAPSPPLEKMLKELIPMISGGLAVPDEMLTTLKKAASKRNRVVHREEPPPELELLDEFMNCVDQLLWLFDVLRGETWARARLDGELRKQVDARLATAPGT